MLRNIHKLGNLKSFTRHFVRNSSFKYSNLNIESFASGTNAVYLEQLYSSWQTDPNSVDISWQKYFSNVEKDLNAASAYQSPPTLDPSKLLMSYLYLDSTISSGNQSTNSSENSEQMLATLRLLLLIRAYQKNGYLDASVDPLNMPSTVQTGNIFKDALEKYTLNYKNYGFSEADLEKEFLVHDKRVAVNSFILTFYLGYKITKQTY